MAETHQRNKSSGDLLESDCCSPEDKKTKVELLEEGEFDAIQSVLEMAEDLSVAQSKHCLKKAGKHGEQT